MIKQLIWKTREDDVVFSEPQGLKYSYYIYPQLEGFELVLLDDNGYYDESLTISHTTLLFAKEKAQNHYAEIILGHTKT